MLTEHLVLAIHGVGDPSFGEIARDIRVNLTDAGIPSTVIEFNWNQLVSKPWEDNALKFGAMEELGFRLASVSLVCSDPYEGEERSKIATRVFRFHNACYFLAESIVALLVATVFVLFPLSYLFGVISYTFSHRYFTAATPIVIALKWQCLALGVSTSCFFLSSFLLAAIHLDAAPAWIAVRRFSILVTRPFFLSCAPIFLVRWRAGAYRAAAGTLDFVITALWLPVISFVILLFLGSHEDRAITVLLLVFAIAAPVVPVIAFGVLALFAQTAVRPVAKILLDIFRYAGDP